MNDEELDQIRNIVREEMATQTSTQSSTPTGRIPNLINRTRSMIQAAATSVCNNTLNTTPSPARQTNPHRDRISFGSSKRKKSEIKIIPVVLAVLKYRKEDEYPLTSDCFLLSEVHINLTTAMNESEIRIAIKSAIGSKLPFVSKDDFKFVKGINKRVIVPTTSADYSFAYPQVKKLMGSGKLYIQLKFQLSPPESGDEYTDDDSVELPQALFPRASTSFGPSTSTSSLSGTSPSRPSTSSSSGPSTSSASGPSTSSASGPSTSSPSGPSTSSPFGPSTSSPSGPSTSSLYGPSSSSSEDQVISTVKTIQEIFPWLSENCIQFMSTQRSDVNELLNHLLTLSPQKLLSCQIECNPKQRIVVDKEFIVEECISSYKDPNFDINFPLRIVFRGEPGVDAGGLLREFYSLFFEKICTDRAFDLFEGDGSALMPKSNFNICMTEIFVTLGKIVAHNICQNGIGFPYLAPAIFEYIAHASVPHAALFLTLADANLGYQHYIAQISNANEDELADLRNDNDFMSIMQEIGETCMLNLTTRHQVRLLSTSSERDCQP
ncbi:uncharacterized protein [Clytia hemisphaerica]|uniref:uncharacterized protein isoform X2 n=1 Tax=Clytia hemisphaerica TaxID=252671 RepID=UPI0034D673AB